MDTYDSKTASRIVGVSLPAVYTWGIRYLAAPQVSALQDAARAASNRSPDSLRSHSPGGAPQPAAPWLPNDGMDRALAHASSEPSLPLHS